MSTSTPSTTPSPEAAAAPTVPAVPAVSAISTPVSAEPRSVPGSGDSRPPQAGGGGARHPNRLPFLTADLPGIGGVIKAKFDDFVVEEIPAYDPRGEGTHTYMLVEKQGLTTLQAVRDIARALGVPPRDIGYAGLKDARASTRQWMSVEHVAPEKVAALRLPKIKVLETSLHTNKIKIGHLSGNRFRIRIREFDLGGLAVAQKVMETLGKRGIPNYFGPQRFGARGDTWAIGAAMVRGDFSAALGQYLGKPSDADEGFFVEARKAYELGQFRRAHDLWPYMYREERRALKTLDLTGGNVKRAWFGVDPALKRLFLSAYQSRLFNTILAGRLDGMDRLMAGDLAFKHDTGAVFRVADPAVEQPRCDRFEISPTGPIFGYRMTRPDGEPGRREDELLAAEGLKGDSLRVIEHNRLKGGRRALRFRAFDSAVRQDTDLDGPFLEFKFTLQKGCYATCLLREILKNDARIGGEHGGSSSGSGDAEGDDDREEGGDDTDRG